MNKSLLSICENAEAARWISEDINQFDYSQSRTLPVSAILPSTFEAYARIFHPAYKLTYTERKVLRWEEVAEQCSRVSHAKMQWNNIFCEHFSDYHAAQDKEIKAGSIDFPSEGSLTRDMATTLWTLLENYTQANNCFFAIWEGYGRHGELLKQAPTLEIPGRRFHIFEGEISAIENSFYSMFPSEPLIFRSVRAPILFGITIRNPFSKVPKYEPTELDELIRNMPQPEEFEYQSANMWWAADNSWCIASEIDLNTTYIGASQEVINAIVNCKNLEAYQVEITDDITNTSDLINPMPLRKNY